MKAPKPHIVALSFVLTLIVCVGSSWFLTRSDNASAFSGGTGTWDDPYVITTCAQLKMVGIDAESVHRNYVLGNNIDCTGQYFYPIGNPDHATTFVPDYDFSGRFDGAGYTIMNITMGSSTSRNMGLFGRTAGAFIHNLTITGFIVTGQTNVAMLAGQAAYTGIEGVNLGSSTRRLPSFGIVQNQSGNPGGDPYNGTYLVATQTNVGTFPNHFYNPAVYSEPSSYTSVGSCAALAAAIHADPNGWYELTNDIDCAGNTNWIPFSTSSTAIFTGRLQGNDHTVSGITLTQTANVSRLGLFQRMYGAIVEDINLEGGGLHLTHASAHSVGALAGLAAGVVFMDVDSTVSPMSSGRGLIGGIAGPFSGLVIDSNVQADITVNASSLGESSGIVAYGWWADVRDSTFEGTLMGDYSLGGITGNIIDVNLDNVHATTTMDVCTYSGGLAGAIFSASSSISNSSANTLFVDCTLETQLDGIGGLAGYTSEVLIENTVASSTVNLSAPTQDGGQFIGGFVGEYNIDSPGLETRNSTSTLYARLLSDPGSTWEEVGGMFGEFNATGWPFLNMSDSYSSSTIIIGTSLAPVGDVTYVGGAFGITDAYIDGFTSDSSIVIYANPASAYVSYVGGYAGDAEGTDWNVRSQSTIDITTNYMDSIGGYGGYTAMWFDSVYSTSTMNISTDGADYIGGFAGAEGANYGDSLYIAGSLSILGGQGGAGTINYVGGYAGGDMVNDYIVDVHADVDITITTDLASGLGGSYFGGFVGHIGGFNVTASSTYTSGSLTFLNTGGTSYFDQIGGFGGNSDDATTDLSHSFSATEINVLAGSTNIGAFFGTSTAATPFINLAYDSTVGAPYDCVGGSNSPEPGWCTAQTTSWFYDSTNEPLASWDFVTQWDEYACHYPTLKALADLFTSISCGGPATPPSVDTDPATLVTDTGATLNGDITAEGSTAPDERGFQYGLTTAYGATSTENGSFSTGTYSDAIGSLSCNTTYHFRAYASSADGLDYGADEAFTTDACTAPTTGVTTASSISRTEMTLNSSITSEGSATPTERGFQYGLTTSYGATTSASGSFGVGAYSRTVFSLTCGTTYHVRSFAESATGPGYGADTTVTTSACSSGSSGGTRIPGYVDTKAPLVSNVNSAIHTDGSVTITWDTDEPASTQVEHGPTQCLGLVTPEKDNNKKDKNGVVDPRTTKHVVILPATACKNSAHFAAISVDASGNRAFSPGHSNNVQLCPSSSPEPADELLQCPISPIPTPTPVPTPTPSPLPIPTPTPPGTSGGGTPLPVPPLTPIPPAPEVIPLPPTPPPAQPSEPSTPAPVVVNDGETTTPDRIVPIVITPPPGTVEVIIVDPTRPEDETVVVVPGVISPLPTDDENNEGEAPLPNDDQNNDSDSPSSDSTNGGLLPPTNESTSTSVPPSSDGMIPPITIDWDLCGDAVECEEGTHAVTVTFVDKDGATIRRDSFEVELLLPANAIGGVEGLLRMIPQLFNEGTVRAAASLSNTIQYLGVLMAGAGITWTLISTGRSLGELPLMAYRGFSGLFALGLFRRKDRAWGTVYDSHTKRPLDPAIVTLLDAEGKSIKNAITDLDGRYVFVVDPGMYSMHVAKSHHTFPIRDLTVFDPVYTEPYHGGLFTVSEEGVVAKDVPMDPVDFDWNEEEKYRKGIYRFFSRFDRPFAYGALLLTPAGAAFALVALAVTPNALNLFLVLLYGVIGIMYLAGLRPLVHGFVTERKVPLANGIIRAYYPGSYDTPAAQAVTDPLGRFYLLLPPGDTFNIRVERKIAINQYERVYERTESGLHGRFNRNIRL